MLIRNTTWEIRFTYHPVDLGGGVAAAQAVVDVDDGQAGGTAVEHGEQGGQAAEGGAVADAGRDGDPPGSP